MKKLITNQSTSDLSKLYDEGALLSRMCCKVQKKFRGEKLFRRLRQVCYSKQYTTVIYLNLISFLLLFRLLFH